MKIIDLYDPQRVNRVPDDSEILLKSGDFDFEEFLIKKNRTSSLYRKT